jgi:hypothetical protein
MKTNDIKSLLTKFFYKNDHLFFQILIQDEMSAEVYGEYGDYEEYRRTFNNLQNSMIDWTPLRLVQDRTVGSESAFAKVA